MSHKEDERLQRTIEQRLGSHGLRAPCRISVNVARGVVTLSGTVQYDYQRRTAQQACRAVDGVRNLVDQLQVTPQARRWE